MDMFERIKQLLVTKLQIQESEIKPEAELVNDLGINSLELADLVTECEDEFNIEIDDDSIRNFVTVKDVVDYLSGKVKD